MDISGSKVLLTGATGGLGHAIARALASGAQLILTGRGWTCWNRSRWSCTRAL